MTDPKPPILVVPERQAVLADELEQDYEVHRYWLLKDREAFFDGPGREVRAVVCGGAFVPPNDFLDRLPLLGLMACVSVGYEKIDVDWCRTRGVAISTGAGANAGDVADHALSLILTGWRRVREGDALVRAGAWVVDGKPRSRSIAGRRVGIVGMGAIGQALARRLQPLEVEVAWWGPRPKPHIDHPRADSLLALAEAADILVVASRGDDSDRNLIDAAVVGALGPDGLLVNIARGSVVDEDAVISALKSGRLGGAALDVFQTEPTASQRWLDVPNTVLTPHMAGATFEATQLLWGQAKANLANFYAGRPLATPLGASNIRG